MANAKDEYKEEFIELYNTSDNDIDISSWTFTDGDDIDTIIPWDQSEHGIITSTNIICNQIIISSKSFAVIVDADYANSAQPYSFGSGAILLTIKNTTLGGSGLSNTSDPITLYDNYGKPVSTYGTPLITISSTTYKDADDDNLDNIPFDPGNGISAERINPYDIDITTNWAVCTDPQGCTPGSVNRVYKEEGNSDDSNGQNDDSDDKQVSVVKTIITEVMPYDKTGDWIELFVLSGSGSINGYKLYEGNKIIKVFPDITPGEKDYIIITFNSDQTDEVFDKGENGYWDLFTTDTGLVATDNTIVLKDNQDNIIDFIAFANNDATWSDTNKQLFEQAVNESVWKTESENFSQADCVSWKNSQIDSITRKKDTYGMPQDTDTVEDWEICLPSKASGYGINDKDDQDNTDIGSSFLYVLNSPICPYGEIASSYAVININNADSSAVSVKIFDVQGRMVRNLYNENNIYTKQLLWDGTDDNGYILPVGVYIVFAETVNEETGRTKQAKKIVVITKRL